MTRISQPSLPGQADGVPTGEGASPPGSLSPDYCCLGLPD